MSLKEIISKPQVTFVDVRSEEEYEMNHYPGAKNIPLYELMQNLDDLKQIKNPIVIYCQSGARSSNAFMYLKQQGFENIYDAGGLQNLMNLKN